MPCKEPFVNLLTQGMVMGQSFKVKETGLYLGRDQVDFSGETRIICSAVVSKIKYRARIESYVLLVSFAAFCTLYDFSDSSCLPKIHTVKPRFTVTSLVRLHHH